MWAKRMGIEDKMIDNKDRKALWISKRIFNLLETNVKVCINYDGVMYNRGGECVIYNAWCPFARKYYRYMLCDREQYHLKFNKEV